MDIIDNDLLFLLEKDCMIPLHELAAMLQCSEEEVAARRVALEEKKIIRGYTALIEAHNPSVTAIVQLRATPEHEYGYDRIAERIVKFSNVKNLHLQLLLQGKTMHEVSSFVYEHIDRIKEIATHIIMKTYKANEVLYYKREDGTRLPFSF